MKADTNSPWKLQNCDKGYKHIWTSTQKKRNYLFLERKTLKSRYLCVGKGN